MTGIECAFTAVVGSAPELRQAKAGKTWCSFSARVGEGEAAQWVRVAAFGAMADVAAALAKGASVYVGARVKLDTWQTTDGEARAGLSVAASLVQPLGRIGRRRPKTEPSSAGARDWQRPTGPGHEMRHRPAAADMAGQPSLNDPIPF